jgi:hypothetical protein
VSLKQNKQVHKRICPAKANPRYRWGGALVCQQKSEQGNPGRENDQRNPDALIANLSGAKRHSLRHENKPMAFLFGN